MLFTDVDMSYTTREEWSGSRTTVSAVVQSWMSTTLYMTNSIGR